MARTSKHDFGCCHHPHCWQPLKVPGFRCQNSQWKGTVNCEHWPTGSSQETREYHQWKSAWTKSKFQNLPMFPFFRKNITNTNGKIDLQWPTGPLSNADIWIIRPFSMKSVKFDLDKTITLGEPKIQSVPKLNHFTLAPSCTGIRNGDGK